MKCKDIEKLMVLEFYGEATPGERRRLDHHVQNCSDCTAKVRAMRADLLRMRESASKVPEFDWDDSWKNIDTILTRELKNRIKSKLLHGMPLKAAATVGIFCLGILVGRLVFNSPSPEAAKDVDLSGKILSLLDSHLGTVRISLLEYMNFHDPKGRSVFLLFEKKQTDHLLFQNRLLISCLKDTENPALINLLESLNFILQEVANLSPEKSEYLDFIKSLLQDSEILFRIDYFQREGIREKGAKERLL